MKKQTAASAKLTVHFIEPEIAKPYNPVTVNLIGAGGTGGQMLTALARINHALIALGHPGLMVSVFDDDSVSPANLGRQLFTTAEIGQHKAAALINRVNRFFGTNWKAITERYDRQQLADRNQATAVLTVSCVDTAAARFGIAHTLMELKERHFGRGRPKYWLDLGNSRDSGQVILSTVGNITQPKNKDYIKVGNLSFATDEFRTNFKAAENEPDQPSCSLAEALTRQDLFINSALANIGASLLWSLFRDEYLLYRGFFLNLAGFKTQPLKVGTGNH